MLRPVGPSAEERGGEKRPIHRDKRQIDSRDRLSGITAEQANKLKEYLINKLINSDGKPNLEYIKKIAHALGEINMGGVSNRLFFLVNRRENIGDGGDISNSEGFLLRYCMDRYAAKDGFNLLEEAQTIINFLSTSHLLDVYQMLEMSIDKVLGKDWQKPSMIGRIRRRIRGRINSLLS